jgi:hypothetical protein
MADEVRIHLKRQYASATTIEAERISEIDKNFWSSRA